MNSDPTSPTPTTATRIFCWLAAEDMMDRVRSKPGVATKNLAWTDGRMIWKGVAGWQIITSCTHSSLYARPN